MHYTAKWQQKQSDGKILCTLCPRYCRIGEEQAGFCYIRKNISGTLYALGYGRPTGFAVDPIEKKPLSHFLPGTNILSFGTAGCNLGCKFCQNWSMSKAQLDDTQALHATPEQVVELALKNKLPSIAYTYNDPIIFGEYVMDISRLARQENIRSVMVSEKFYYKLTGAHLQPVLDTLIWLKQETGVWLELTTLLIPDENDSEEEIKQMCGWILKNLGDSVPLHFTAFHPSFLMQNHKATPPQTLTQARKLALDAGIKYCYVGNVHDPEGQTTFCPGCNAALIERDWHSVYSNRMDKGKCPTCGAKIAGYWE